MESIPEADRRPLVGVTTNVDGLEARVRRSYLDAITRAGGIPLLLAPPTDPDQGEITSLVDAWIRSCDGFVLTGGEDPNMEPFGIPTHPSAKRMDSSRQLAESTLLHNLSEHRPTAPVLGICLGMQLMGLVDGATLNQHMPDDVPSHDLHWGDKRHRIQSMLTETDGARRLEGTVTSNHHQALRETGPHLRVLSEAQDGVIEAIDRPERPFWVGVQWHPERSGEGPLGSGLFRELIDASREHGVTSL